MIKRKKDKIHRSFYFWLRKREIITLPNFYFGRYEMDLFCLTQKDLIVEYEVKISKSDFRADFLKSHFDNGTRVMKHDLIRNGLRSNQFYFVAPCEIIDKEEVPSYCGLIHFNANLGNFKIVKRAPVLHHRNPDLAFYKNFARSLAFRESNIRAKYYSHG